MIVNAIDAEESRIAMVKDGVLDELLVEIASRESYLGNIYKGRVVNIEPSIGAAFVSFGGSRNGFLHASDVLPAYANPDISLADIVEGRARIEVGDGPDTVRALIDEDDDDGGSSAPAAGRRRKTRGRKRVRARAVGAADEPPGTEGGGEAGATDTAVFDPEPEPEPESAGEPEVTTEAAAVTAEDGAQPELDSGADGDTARIKSKKAERVGRPRLPIQQLLKKGQELVVQITKEGIGMKGPTLTTYISLPGRCLVLMPSLPKCGVSRKIDDERERRRLKRIVKDLDETGSGGIGFIVRTAGVQKTAEELRLDYEYLKKIWEVLVKRVKSTRAPASLYEESDLVMKTMRDLFTPDVDEVVVDSEPVCLRIKEFLDKMMPDFANRVRQQKGTTPIFHAFGIEKELEGLFRPQIELKNGGSIVVEQTEALVAIDVNSGKYRPGADLEETAFRTNLEAIPEIARQLRLRDLGGLIIIDFIDMTQDKHRRDIERRFRDALREDRARIKVGRISAFGMLELTRQRVGPGLKRTVFTPCPTCRGTTLVRSVQSKALSVLREIRAIIHLPGFQQAEVYTHPEVAVFLANRKRRELVELEDHHGRAILVRGEVAYPVDMVHYRFLNEAGQEVKVPIPAGLGVKP